MTYLIKLPSPKKLQAALDFRAISSWTAPTDNRWPHSAPPCPSTHPGARGGNPWRCDRRVQSIRPHSEWQLKQVEYPGACEIWNSGSSLSNHPPHGAHTRSRIANHPLMTWFINHQPRSLAWTLPPSWVWLHTQACNHLFLSSTYIPGIWTELLICVGSSSSMPIGGPMIHSPTHPGQIPRGHLRIPPSLHHPLRPAGPFCPGLPLESHPATDASVQSLISGLLPEGPASALSSPSAKLSKQNWSHSATANIPGNSASPNRLKPKPVSIVLYELVPNYLFNFISLVLFFP